tara:strand:+ start:1099 stop:1338 length:240 start_codon:yes stop_codon:yes gene_type:complete
MKSNDYDDFECLKEILNILIDNEREDLVNYLNYLCETIVEMNTHINEVVELVEESESEEELEEEIFEVGLTEDGFHYLK